MAQRSAEAWEVFQPDFSHLKLHNISDYSALQRSAFNKMSQTETNGAHQSCDHWLQVFPQLKTPESLNWPADDQLFENLLRNGAPHSRLDGSK